LGGFIVLRREGMRLRRLLRGWDVVLLLGMSDILRRVIALLRASFVLLVVVGRLLMILLRLRFGRGEEASWLVLLLAVGLRLGVVGRGEDGRIDGSSSSRRCHDDLASKRSAVRWKSNARAIRNTKY
jgi:hypothetical protein